MSKPHTEHNKKALTATGLRTILLICLLFILIAMAGGFYVAHGQLKTYAKEVADTQAEAKSADAKLDNLVQLEKKLQAHRKTAEKSEQIVAASQGYAYQNQVIEDLTAYASRASVSITAFSFQSTGDSANSASTPAPATDSGGTTNAAPQQSTSQSDSSAVRNTVVTISITSPVPYTNLLHFMHLIEENLTRMQITELSLSKGESAHVVGTNTLNIEVYIR